MSRGGRRLNKHGRGGRPRVSAPAADGRPEVLRRFGLFIVRVVAGSPVSVRHVPFATHSEGKRFPFARPSYLYAVDHLTEECQKIRGESKCLGQREYSLAVSTVQNGANEIKCLASARTERAKVRGSARIRLVLGKKTPIGCGPLLMVLLL